MKHTFQRTNRNKIDDLVIENTKNNEVNNKKDEPQSRLLVHIGARRVWRRRIHRLQWLLPSNWFTISDSHWSHTLLNFEVINYFWKSYSFLEVIDHIKIKLHKFKPVYKQEGQSPNHDRRACGKRNWKKFFSVIIHF